MLDILRWKKILLFIISLFLLVNTFPIVCASDVSKEINFSRYSTASYIIIPDDYSSIQDGINHASPGDEIFVRSGLYKENIIINKENLILSGENKFTTIIDGGKTTNTVIISAPGVSLQNFTVQNGWDEDILLWYVSGVYVSSSNVVLKNNIFTKNRLGVNTGPDASNLTISDNQFIDDGLLIGSFKYEQLKEENFYHIITNNTINGKPLYYYAKKHNFSVPRDAGQIILINCTNASIKDMYITHTDFSIFLGFCSNCVIENNIVDTTDGELILVKSRNCIIQNNTLSYNLHGICLDYQSKNNTVRNNEAYGNYIGISSMTSAQDNNIYKNNLHDNTFGIWILNQSYNNVVSKNRIYKNSVGLKISLISSENIIKNNIISYNLIGVLLRSFSNNNAIENNTFKRNLLSSIFTNCSTNKWNHNYWDRPRLFPKIIFGFKTIGRMPVPWMNVDRSPAKTPIS